MIELGFVCCFDSLYFIHSSINCLFCFPLGVIGNGYGRAVGLLGNEGMMVKIIIARSRIFLYINTHHAPHSRLLSSPKTLSSKITHKPNTAAAI